MPNSRETSERKVPQITANINVAYGQFSHNTYSLDKYLQSDAGIGDRLLRSFNADDISRRAHAVRDEVQILADEMVLMDGG
ncbi:hypothetical protein BT67DRAFT_440599 [Trichocladium antarcticum]|uniref:Uncharacterized protein n=1 Tax=Trichocladium antarcticum TaxID=1450529 RepID=A0AAN6ZF89_9PEZI|nr:hypothetical protein BT67DRAFT_440599 [Trichocladium antarcticum]